MKNLDPRRARWVKVRMILLVLAAVDLWTIDRHYWGSSPRAEVVYAPNEITEYIKKANQKEQGRVMGRDIRHVPRWKTPVRSAGPTFSNRFRFVSTATNGRRVPHETSVECGNLEPFPGVSGRNRVRAKE